MGRIYGRGRWYDEGLFKGKRAMASLTTGGPEFGLQLLPLFVVPSEPSTFFDRHAGARRMRR
jgi:hypothetical protein